jgi:hypothetical protein
MRHLETLSLRAPSRALFGLSEEAQVRRTGPGSKMMMEK